MDFKPQNAKKAATVEEAAAQCRTPVLEPKLDGWRLVAFVTEDGPKIFSRTQKPYIGRYPEMEAELAKLPVGTILDGEIVAMGSQDSVDVTTVFGKSVSVTTPEQRDKLTYVVFDMLAFAGIDACQKPLKERRAALEKMLTGFGLDVGRVALITQIENPTTQDYMDLVERGYEGAMIKDAEKPYAKGKRGHGFFKVKAMTEIDVFITGMELNGKGQHEGKVGNFEVSQYKLDVPGDGETGEVVKRAMVNPYDDAMRNAMTADRELVETSDGRSLNGRPLYKSIFIGRVCTIHHYGVLKDGLRHPTFTRWREDKPAEECVWDDG